MIKTVMKCANPKCGKEHNGSFGSGKFCSKQCANSRTWSDAQKLHKGIANKQSEKYREAIKRKNEKRWEKTCPMCNEKFQVPKCHKNQIYCSKKCYLLDSPPKFRKVNRTPIQHGDSRKAWGTKTGYYKGIYCGSSYELAYLIYCLDHNIEIQRCEENFQMSDGHKYFPDLYVGIP